MIKQFTLFVLAGSIASSFGAQSLEFTYRTAGPAVHQAFEPVREFLQSSSAVIRRGREEVIFGTVVSPDGHVLTKASELGDMEGLSVTVDRDTFSSPRIVAEDPVWDVALLKIEASNLVPVQLFPLEEHAHGTWLVANGATTRSNRRVQVGVVAANEREVFAKGGTVLGVALKDDEENELIVAEITEGSGAEEAGLQVDDQIIKVAGTKVKTRAEVADELKERRVGDEIRILVIRKDQEIELKVKLSGRVDLFGEEASRNDMMSGEYSERRSGFPRVMQHDIIGNKHFMGGPVFNLDGQCVGMNIARFSRCETYAIPAKELMLIVDRLMKESKAGAQR
ncbi:S1C family serine protease [Haloferula chungangensis]|uniref:S1C family serine protease n=1 Tax=Haloferula chungangensis TaxID=1048331 RepID=A0ABW2L4U1_9BACT